MIVNLHGSVRNDGQIIFDSVSLYFDVNQSVNVNEVFITFSKKMKSPYGYISTSLIDKSPVNQKQLIVFLQESTNVKQTYISPTHTAKYKIQCQSLQSAKFNLHLFEEGEKVNLQQKGFTIEVYLQLEITSDARVLHQLKTS